MSDDTSSPAPPARAPTGLVIDVNPRRLVRVVFLLLSAAIVGLWLLDYHVNYSRGIDLAPVRRLFNATREDGLGSWFMVTLTLAVAFVLWLIVLAVHRLGLGRWRTIGWGFLALLFSYMAVDDGALIHERVGSSWRILSERAAEAAGSGDAGGLLSRFPSYPWQVLFVPLFAIAGLFMAVFLWKELNEGKGRAFVFAALAILALCVGLDFVEGLDEEHSWNVPARVAMRYEGLETATRERFQKSAYESLRHFSKTTEECLEMLAMTVLLVTFLGRWMSLAPEWHLRFAQGHERGAAASGRGEAAGSSPS